MTFQRKLILDTIKENCYHLNAIEIYDIVRSKNKISLATVYNSLNYLADNGFITRISIAGEADRFDGNTHFHHHAICDRCKSVMDIETKDIAKEIESNYGVKVTSLSFNLHCICKNCQKTDKNN